jgi:hypothetical protein
MVRAQVSAAGLNRVSVLPCYINDQAQPRLLRPDEPQFDEVADYLKTVSQQANLNLHLRRSEDAWLVEGA